MAKVGTAGSSRAAVLTYGIASPCFVELDICSISGRRIVEIDKGDRTPGRYSVTIEKGVVEDGMYVCRLRAGNYEESQLLGAIK
jgi:hypothetical protein